MADHVQCIYCDARSEGQLCEECLWTLKRYRHGVQRLARPAAVHTPFVTADFMALVHDVCAAHEVRPTDLLPHMKGRSGQRALVCARKALYSAMEGRGLTLGEIGQWVKRERSSIFYVLRGKAARRAVAHA